ncbi:hypothetical protein F5Y17DRAFT_417234, partial [Xylariaceae sp. FL0594]
MAWPSSLPLVLCTPSVSPESFTNFIFLSMHSTFHSLSFHPKCSSASEYHHSLLLVPSTHPLVTHSFLPRFFLRFSLVIVHTVFFPTFGS